MLFTTAIVFAPGWRWMFRITAGGLIHPALQVGQFLDACR